MSKKKLAALLVILASAITGKYIRDQYKKKDDIFKPEFKEDIDHEKESI